MQTNKNKRTTTQSPKKEGGGKKKASVAITTAAVLLVALAVTLSLTFGLRKKPVTDETITTVVPPVEDKLTFTAPLANCTITKAAALNKLVYNDTLKQWRTHNGVDFEAAAGSDVWAIADGKVEKVENTILDGTVITISHKKGYVSVYKGLGSAAVQEGDAVSSGTVIGKVGNMMCEQNSGAHLHLEMKKDGKYVVATDYLELAAEK